jgi:hypothetical protein
MDCNGRTKPQASGTAWQVKPGTNDFEISISRTYVGGKEKTDSMGEFNLNVDRTFTDEMIMLVGRESGCWH